MSDSRLCPDADEYRRLTRGEPGAPADENLLTHLEQCGTCARKFGELPEGDTLVDLVREAATVEMPPPSGPVAELIGALSRLTPPASATAGDSKPALASTGHWEGGAAEQFPPDLYDWLHPPHSAGELGRLGRYSVLQVLGAGGMGVVFRARDPQLERIIALKAALPRLGSRPNARDRFLREARAMAAIKHEHIVSIYEVGEDRGVPYLAMEFLEGEPLNERLNRAGKLPVSEVLRIGREIALGLSAAHKRGLIHRDIKPGNLWLEAEGDRVKILDFGLARAAGIDQQLTQPGAIVGTPEYMAPEQAQGGDVDQRCDLFSLGCVLYRMATGRSPFRGTDVVSTLLAVSTHTPPTPAELAPEVPLALSELIMNLLARDPAGRPESADDVARSLDQLARPAPPGTPAAARHRNVPLLAGAGLLIFALLVLWATGVIQVRTPEGTIVLEGLPPDARIEVDGSAGRVTYQAEASTFDVQVAPGERQLLITAPGFAIKTQEVTLTPGERKPIRIRLEPLVPAQQPAQSGIAPPDATENANPGQRTASRAGVPRAGIWKFEMSAAGESGAEFFTGQFRASTDERNRGNLFQKTRPTGTIFDKSIGNMSRNGASVFAEFSELRAFDLDKKIHRVKGKSAISPRSPGEWSGTLIDSDGRKWDFKMTWIMDQ